MKPLLALVLAATAAPSASEQATRSATAMPAPVRFVYAGELTQGGWLKGSVPRGTVALTLKFADADLAVAPGASRPRPVRSATTLANQGDLF